MNAQTIIKSIAASLAVVSLGLIPSCAHLDPGYAEYKKQKQAQATAAANPYGAPTAGTPANPYAVPGLNGETNAPYQSIQGVPDNPPVVDNPPAPVEPYRPLPAEPSGEATTHTVVKGDTIWGLTKKYGISDDALRQANNLNTDTIWVGQRLTIPAK